MKITIGNVELAEFEAGDTDALYAVRNDPGVRRYMADPSPLDYEAHVAWVTRHLGDARALLLFLIRVDGEPTGCTLLRPVDDETLEIGVMFRDAARYLMVPYYATVATLSCAFVTLGRPWVVSWVVPGHERAMALNRSFGASEEPSEKPGMVKWRLHRDVCLANENYRKVMRRIEPRMRITSPERSRPGAPPAPRP